MSYANFFELKGKIIKEINGLEINNDEVFKFIWEKLSSNLGGYDAKQLILELINTVSLFCLYNNGELISG